MATKPTPTSKRLRAIAPIVIALALLAVIVVDAVLILGLSNTQSDELGNTQLDVIRADLEDTLIEAQANVLHVAMGAEQLLDSGASREELTQYIYEQREKYLARDSFMNVYIAGREWYIVPEFDAPDDFHPAERVWYIGAQDRPDEVYISEPYLDADTGGMCFTVSTILADGEAVVGMDLNFSKVQESILRMTQGRDETAMIVTSEGTIVGYTDMSLVGERADERLPEYADILKRVASSQKHDSFRVRLDGRPCMVFSSETANGWYLILSVNTGTLYGESYRHIALLVVVNLLMLAAVIAYCVYGTRRIRHADQTTAKVTGGIDAFSGRVHDASTHLPWYDPHEPRGRPLREQA